MAGEDRGTQAQEQGQETGGQAQQQEPAKQGATSAGGAGAGAGEAGGSANGGDDGTGGSTDYAKAIADRDKKIAELEAQVNAAAESAERAEKLTAEIKAVREKAESDRVEYQLTLAGARNVKAARALLADHDGDVEALKTAEPWLFGVDGKGGTGATKGKTGLNNAGAASSEGALMKRWRKIAGIPDDKNE